MHTYSCGNCGETLPGPDGETLPGPDVAKCPYCGVLLRGAREGSEEERLQRQRAYRRNRPEAIRRREKTREFFGMLGVILGIGAVIALFVCGGAALGWFVLTKIFDPDAALPLAVAGTLFGGLLLQLLKVAIFEPIFLHLPSYVTGESDEPSWLWDRKKEVLKQEQTHKITVSVLRIFLFLLVAAAGGFWGWRMDLVYEFKIGTLLNILLGFGLAYLLAKRWDKENAPPSWWQVRDREIAASRLQRLMQDSKAMALLTDALAHPEKIDRLPKDMQEVARTLQAEEARKRSSEFGFWQLVNICARMFLGGIILGTIANELWGPKGGISGFLIGFILGYMGWLGNILGYIGLNPFWEHPDTSKKSKPSLKNINTAAAEELQRLPGIGPKVAQNIIAYRQRYGGLSNIDDLMKVPGIGPATFLRVKDLITIE